jgi:hypothetical protein
VHNGEVLSEWLGLSSDETHQLEAEQILLSEMPSDINRTDAEESSPS